MEWEVTVAAQMPCGKWCYSLAACSVLGVIGTCSLIFQITSDTPDIHKEEASSSSLFMDEKIESEGSRSKRLIVLLQVHISSFCNFLIDCTKIIRSLARIQTLDFFFNITGQ